jgi:hypothetical protein
LHQHSSRTNSLMHFFPHLFDVGRGSALQTIHSKRVRIRKSGTRIVGELPLRDEKRERNDWRAQRPPIASA